MNEAETSEHPRKTMDVIQREYAQGKLSRALWWVGVGLNACAGLIALAFAFASPYDFPAMCAGGAIALPLSAFVFVYAAQYTPRR